MHKLVFFDLDGTILEGVSSENAFIMHLLQHGYFGWKQWLSTVLFVFRWFFHDGIYVFIKNKAYLNGLFEKEVVLLGADFVKKNLLPKIRPWMRKKVDMHLAGGDTVILLTGTHSFLANVFARNLHIDTFFATECVVQDGKFTSAPPKQHPFRKAKREIVERVCNTYGASLAQCVAYGNSKNDIYLLEAVGEPYAVTPDHGLRKVAKQKGWQICDAPI